MRRHKHGYGWGPGFAPGFAPAMFHCLWRWHGGFPRRQEYLEMLKAYKEELEAMQRDIAEELREVSREIEREDAREEPGG